MRVGIITNRNLGSPWASTHFYIHRALRHVGIDAVHVAGQQTIAQLAKKKGRRQSGKPTTPFLPELAEAIRRDVEQSDYDLLLALHASTVIPTLKIKCPLVYVTDATAVLLNDYYPDREELSEQDQQWLQKCEETTLAKSDAILVPSQWTADSVLQDYQADPDRVHVLEWGGNLNEIPKLAEEEDASKSKLKAKAIRFLFVGLDWHRKGGDLAVETVLLLRAAGIEATLTVVGASIPKEHRSPFVRSVGMLNRANPAQSKQLDQLFLSSDFYLHPARAECYGHVLCEAAGFGLPVIATDTGGISQCVIGGETGLLLPPGSPASAFAQRLRELLANESLLAEMKTNAALDFRRRLNWDHWATRTQQVMHGLLSSTVSTSSESCGS